jgi:hypothetical protein
MPFSLGLPSSSLGIVLGGGGGLGALPLIPTPVGFRFGDVFSGGSNGFVEVIHRDGLAAFPHYLDALDDLGNRMLVPGETNKPSTGDLFVCLADPAFATDYNPLDLVYLPNNSGLAVLIARLTDTLELWVYPFNVDGTLGTPVTHAGLDTDAGWDHTVPCKLDVFCDSRHVLYTDRGDTVFAYDLQTGTQLAPFLTLSGTDADDYDENAFKIIRPGKDIVVAETTSGNGPRNAVCLDSDKLSVWRDEINPPGAYHIFRGNLSDGLDGPTYLAHTVDLGGVNDQVWSLACWYSPCPVRRQVFVWNVG